VRAVADGATQAYASSASGFAAGVWQHGIAEFKNDASRTAYLNGVPGTANTTNMAPASVTLGTIGGLRRTALAIPFTGSICDVLIFNRVLSRSEIAALADPQWSIMCGGLIVPRRRIMWPVGAGAAGGTVYERSASESMGVSDAGERAVSFARTVAETLTLGDAAEDLAAYVRTAAETEGVTDASAAVASYVREAAESVGVADAADRIVAFVRQAAETEGVADAGARIAAFVRETAEAEGLTDAATTYLGGVVKAAVLFLALKRGRN